jgi:hypothetical protein
MPYDISPVLNLSVEMCSVNREASALRFTAMEDITVLIKPEGVDTPYIITCPPVVPPPLTLVFDFVPPTQRENGEPLTLNEVVSYKIRVTLEGDTVTSRMQSVNKHGEVSEWTDDVLATE